MAHGEMVTTTRLDLTSSMRDMAKLRTWVTPLFILVVFGLMFWGYRLDRLHYSDLLYFSDELPAFWGLSIQDSATGGINYSFLYHNEGLMALRVYLINRMPIAVEEKLILVNGLNMAIQLLNAFLFASVVKTLVGNSYIFPFLAFYLLYPFLAAVHYWQTQDVNSFAATLFLCSLRLFLQVDYRRERLVHNLVCYLASSLLLLWLSIITVEWAVTLSPLYLYLALYHENGKTTVLRFQRVVTPYTALAAVFLLTSLLPLYLFAGRGNISASAMYLVRYDEVASFLGLPTAVVGILIATVNCILVYTSYLFANTLGLLLYPALDLIRHRTFLLDLGLGLIGAITAVSIIGSLLLGHAVKEWKVQASSYTTGVQFKFLGVFGLLWAILAYFPFSLSFGYPRNVGLFADRVNLLGSMGVVLSLGSLWCMAQGYIASQKFFGRIRFYAGACTISLILLLNLQIQKAMYVEAEEKDRAIADVLIGERARWSAFGKEPIFILASDSYPPSLRSRVRRALSEGAAIDRLISVGHFFGERYFGGQATPVSFRFNFNGINWFAGSDIEFYARLKGERPLEIYKFDERVEVSEDAESYRIGYVSTEVWETPNDIKAFQVYPKSQYEFMRMELMASSFRLGGPLQYAFKSSGGIASTGQQHWQTAVQ